MIGTSYTPSLATAKTLLERHVNGEMPAENHKAHQDGDPQDTMKQISKLDQQMYRLKMIDRGLAGIPDQNPDPQAVLIDFNGTKIEGEFEGNKQVGSFAVEEDGVFQAVQFTDEAVHGVAVYASDEGTVVETTKATRFGITQADSYLFAKE